MKRQSLASRATPDLAHLLDHKHGGPPELRLRLGPPALALLRRVATGHEPTVTGERVKTLALLGAIGDAVDTQLFGAVVQDVEAGTEVRCAAAVALGRIRREGGQEALLACTEATDPLVRGKVYKSLGRVGDASVVPTLVRREPNELRWLERQRELALMLVAFRENLDHEPIAMRDLPRRSQDTPTASLPVKLTWLSADRLADRLAHYDDTQYGLVLSAAFGLAMHVGASRLDLLLNAELVRDGDLSAVFQRRFVAGVAALEHPETGTSSARWVLFSRPDTDERARLLAVRNDGRPVLVGTVVVQGQGARFTVADAVGGRSALWIQGTVERGGVSLEEAFIPRRRRKQLAQPMLLAPFGERVRRG